MAQVQHMYQEKRKSWFHFWPGQTTEVSLNLFNDTCIGVVTNDAYTVDIEWRGAPLYIMLCIIYIASICDIVLLLKFGM